MDIIQLKFSQNVIITILLLCIFGSCNKSDPNTSNGQGRIEVAVSDAEFESESTIQNRAAILEELKIQSNTIELNKDFLMVAELHPHEVVPESKGGFKAALDTTNLGTNIHYRLLVYTTAGAFVTERDYIRSQEASTAALQLDAGTYTFVAVSFNTTTALPVTTPAVASRTLANSRISTAIGTNALMYYKQNVAVAANTVNRLNIILTHKKPLISVTINATQVGYNITALSANFRPHNDGTLVNLSDGSHSQNGTSATASVSFGNLGSQIVNSTSTNYINSATNNSTIFTIPSITIGSITETNLTPFTTLSVRPGVRYNLILNIVPNDRYTTLSGRPVAIINGITWALHNIGVAGTVDPDQTPITSSLHGNYYQFGRSVSVANGTATATNSGWIRNPQNTDAWNTGTELAPVRTSTDPCPTGFRVPTRREVQSLIDNTIHSTKGVMTNNATNYNSASVLTSRRAASVRLVFPHQGLFSVTGSTFADFEPTGIVNRGTVGLTHTSRTDGNSLFRFRPSSTGVTILETDDGVGNYSSATPVRCVRN